MAHKLSRMTWGEIKQEMSIAGNPDKCVQLGKDVFELVANRVNSKNIAELENVQFALMRSIAELKLWARFERDRQRVKP